ncbi:hypothetical protein [Streptomyces sp. YGL11-2]|uniref:hypothetical protein n=1 Tax=Streptomyces sp. YGL11-2 TaxID=3414028 RepID=UPI003CF87FC7
MGGADAVVPGAREDILFQDAEVLLAERELTTVEYSPVCDPACDLRLPAEIRHWPGPRLQDLGCGAWQLRDGRRAAVRPGVGEGAEGDGAHGGGAEQSGGVVGERHLGQHAAQ